MRLKDMKIEKIEILGGWSSENPNILAYYDEPLLYIGTINDEEQLYLFKFHNRGGDAESGWWSEMFAVEISEDVAEHLKSNASGPDEEWCVYEMFHDLAKLSKSTLLIRQDKTGYSCEPISHNEILEMESQ